MRRQPPDNNNPANPLSKVAALDIEKEYLQGTGAGKIKLSVSLTFKKSNDLHGSTKGRDGKNVNVTFSMSIQRASLEIVCSDDHGRHLDNIIKLRKVAFVGSVSGTSKLTENLLEISETKSGTAGKLNAGAKLNLTDVGAKAGANLEAGASLTSSVKKARRIKNTRLENNITATHAGSRVQWEIVPIPALLPTTEASHLVGEVFKSPTTSKSIEACIIERTDNGSIAEVVITGSVYVGMQDLILESIRFTDDTGLEIKTNQINSDCGVIGDLRDNLFQKVAKERILRQVIRKHLIEQGMSVSGSQVEICKASA